MKSLKYIVLFYLVSSSAIMFAQHTPTVLAVKKIERSASAKSQSTQVYKNLGYKEYADVQTSENPSGEGMDEMMMLKIASSYLKNADYENAEFWYAKCINQNSQPKDILNYAQSLQANGRCKDAVQWFANYKSKTNDNSDSAIEFISNCDEVNDFTQHELVSVNNLVSINTPNLDFCPISINNGEGVLFTSSRSMAKTKRDKWTNDNFTDLFYVNKNEKGFGEPQLLKGDVNYKYHDGAASTDKTSKTLYFTRNNYSGKRSNGTIDLKIYEAESIDQMNYVDAKELPFNSNEFASCHPTITADGKTLYFSSDRPGGFGGMDLYFSTKSGENWSTPVNLGATVNSAGNEIFPFITNDGIMIFSSNGHAGIGGLDLYAAKKKNNLWEQVVNCGTPFNTPKDDFGFFMEQNNKTGYLSSNRIGGQGKDDIYEWASSVPVDFFKVQSVMKTICFIEEGSNKKVGNVNIMLDNSANKSFGMTFKSDEKGFFSHEMLLKSVYNFNISKTGYKDAQITINPSIQEKTETECTMVPLEKLEAVSVTGLVRNGSKSNVPLAKAEVVLMNKTTGKSQRMKSNPQGKYNFVLDCNTDYELISSFPNMTNKTKAFSTSENCFGAKDKNIDFTLMSKAPTKTVVPNVLTGTKEIKEGMVIELKNIYYDYNKSNIRSDATVDLEALINLMNTYPKMQIELGSHTDSRGSDSYNAQLSTKRAASARQYLISKGISSNRVSSKGYGETNHINHCSNGVKCSDEEHQQNRRTEVIITKFDNPNVKVKYRN